MLKGFRDFILRGNVIELAVAVIIGAAFTNIVTTISEDFITPLINIFGSPEVGASFHLVPGKESTKVDLGAIITSIINFLIVAGIIYFIIITPMNKLASLQNRNKGVDEEETAAPTEAELLVQIRDLLIEQNTANQNISSAVAEQVAEIKESTARHAKKD